MVINETRKEFGFKLLDYYSRIMKDYSTSNDEESKLYTFSLLLKKSGETLNEIRNEV